jgi:hypothetical protein
MTEEGQQQAELRCPKCGSEEVYEYRQSLTLYRINHGTRQFERTIRGSDDDAVFHRCVNIDCGYGSNLDVWEQEGRSDFAPRQEACQ